MRMAVALIALVACGAPTEPVAPPEPVAAPPTPEEVARAACMDAHCADVEDTEACAEARCPSSPPEVSAGVQRIRWDDGTLFVELAPSFSPARVGDVEVPRDEPVFVGVTAVTPDGTEIDLLVQTLFPGALDQPVIFTAELDRDIDHVLVGLWDRKIEPCDVDRYGCQAFGFVLDGSLATWPPQVYDTGRRQRILSGDVPLRVIHARGMDAARAAELQAAAKEALEGVVGLFGGAVTVIDETGVPRPGTEVRYHHPRDAFAAYEIAGRIAAETGTTPRVRKLSEGLDVPFEVYLGL